MCCFFVKIDFILAFVWTVSMCVDPWYLRIPLDLGRLIYDLTAIDDSV